MSKHMRVADRGKWSGYVIWYPKNKKFMTMDGMYHSSNQATVLVTTASYHNEVTDVSLCGHLGCVYFDLYIICLYVIHSCCQNNIRCTFRIKYLSIYLSMCVTELVINITGNYITGKICGVPNVIEFLR